MPSDNYRSLMAAAAEDKEFCNGSPFFALPCTTWANDLQYAEYNGFSEARNMWYGGEALYAFLSFFEFFDWDSFPQQYEKTFRVQLIFDICHVEVSRDFLYEQTYENRDWAPQDLQRMFEMIYPDDEINRFVIWEHDDRESSLVNKETRAYLHRGYVIVNVEWRNDFR